MEKRAHYFAILAPILLAGGWMANYLLIGEWVGDILAGLGVLSLSVYIIIDSEKKHD